MPAVTEHDTHAGGLQPRREPCGRGGDGDVSDRRRVTWTEIRRVEFPCHMVYDDAHVFAFLDIIPRCPGHTPVIPKAAARNILDITAEDYAHVARGAHRIAAAAMKAFKADGITVQQFSEPAGGQVVFHLHMHVMPRHDGIALLPPASRREDVKVLEDNATRLVAALG